MDMARGQKIKLVDIGNEDQVTVEVDVVAVPTDVSCFGLDGSGRLSDDRYLVFYNQASSPSQEILWTADGTRSKFVVKLSALPSTIDRLSFTAAVDGNGTLAAAGPSRVTVRCGTGEAVYRFSGGDFAQERAAMLVDLYRKDGVWRVNAVGQGFAEGLDALVRHFGGVVDSASSSPPAPPTAPKPAAAPSGPVDLKKQRLVSLEKKLGEVSPSLLSLSKGAAVSLEKRGLGLHTARVALVLDISGSMNALYKSGKVQRLAERILALGTRFDDDGSIDIFLFGTDSHQAGAMDIANYQGFVDRLLQRYPLEGGTQYDRAISEVRRFYFGSDAPRTQPLSQPTPVYVMFVTDGATADPESTKRQVIHSSYEPVFWQFMGIGKSSRKPGAKKRGFLSSLLSADFAFLEQLDILPGRFVDNANFFSVEDPASLADDEIFDHLMEEYPTWLQAIRAHSMIPQ